MIKLVLYGHWYMCNYSYCGPSLFSRLYEITSMMPDCYLHKFNFYSETLSFSNISLKIILVGEDYFGG